MKGRKGWMSSARKETSICKLLCARQIDKHFLISISLEPSEVCAFVSNFTNKETELPEY